MAKEVIPPSPIPVRDSENTISDLYCAAYMNYSEDSFCDVSKELVKALKDEYDNIGLGGSTQSFMAYDMIVNQVQDDILGMGIKGINKFTLTNHAILMQTGDNVMISVNLY